MARNLRAVSFIALVSALVAGTGCTPRGPVAVVLQVSGDPAEIAAYRVLARAFEHRNSDERIRLVAAGNQKDHMAKLATAFAAGDPPDLFLVNYRRFGQFAAKGVLEPLGPAVARRGELQVKDLYSQAVDAFRFDGKLLCLPQNVATPVVYYNTKLFAAAGVRPPASGWTWDDLAAAASALTRDSNGDGRPEVRGLGFEPSLNRLAPFVWQAGGDIVDDLAKPTKMNLLDPPALEVLRFLAGLQHVRKVLPTLAEVESEDLESRFAGGRLAMLIESRRITPTLRAVPGLTWDVAPLPVHPRKRRPAVMLHSDAYCMSRGSEAKDGAVRFVEFALGREGSEIMARTGRTVPSLRSVAEGPAFLDPSQPPKSGRVFLDQIPYVRRFPNIAAWHEVESRADPVIEEWFYGREMPEALGIEVDIETLDLLGPKEAR